MKELYTIESPRPIHCLGGIQGPLSTPTQLSFNDVLYMVKEGYVVYKHNPHDIKEKIRVTKSNINNIKFRRTREIATSERLLNRSIQEMDTPVEKKVVKQVEVKHHEVEEMDVKDLEPVDVVTKNKKESKKIKVSKPDAFKK